uniref:Uncharacterized protein n=1 Tax=Arundo donax TaxID=35708 RepID=A0A0A9BIS6_ARUDO
MRESPLAVSWCCLIIVCSVSFLGSLLCS